MPTYVNIQCTNCKRLYQINIKRFNESIKHNWNHFCSRKCQSEFKDKQVQLKCANQDCRKTFKRQKHSINKKFIHILCDRVLVMMI